MRTHVRRRRHFAGGMEPGMPSGGTWTFGEICVGASDLFKTADKAEKGSGKGKAHDDGAGKNGVSSVCFAHTGRDF